MGRYLRCRTLSGRRPQPAAGCQPAVFTGQRGIAAVCTHGADTAAPAQRPAMAAIAPARLFRDLLLQPVLLLWPALHQRFTGILDRGAEPGGDRAGFLVAVQGALEPDESRRYRDLHGRREHGDRQSQPAIIGRRYRCLDRRFADFRLRARMGRLLAVLQRTEPDPGAGANRDLVDSAGHRHALDDLPCPWRGERHRDRPPRCPAMVEPSVSWRAGFGAGVHWLLRRHP
ncbi:hypothetical protein D3C73_466450 [compost metagenome]